jgi:hypothetical protein
MSREKTVMWYKNTIIKAGKNQGFFSRMIELWNIIYQMNFNFMIRTYEIIYSIDLAAGVRKMIVSAYNIKQAKQLLNELHPDEKVEIISYKIIK